MSDATPTEGLLSGSRGWTTVLVLTLALAMLVTGQLWSSQARASGFTAQTSALPVSAAGTAQAPVRGQAADRPVTTRPAQTPVRGQAVAAAPAVPAVPTAPAVQSVAAVQAVAPAPAELDLCSGDGWQQRRGEAALASLRVGAERTGFAVAFAPARKGYMGLTHLQERRIEVFVRGCEAQSEELLRHVMAHELGHAYDTTHGTAEVRAAYQRARGIPASTPWYGCSGCTDFATPAGDFAEVYAQWARGATSNRSELAGSPGPAELDALARSFFGA